MSFRNRPVLDRRHRPRWREERRTQQLVVGGFALTIAVALGIFGAAAWNGYYNAHLRQVAVVGTTQFDRDALALRTRILALEIERQIEQITERGDPNSPLVQEELNELAGQLQNRSQLEGQAADTLVTGAVQRELARSLGLEVTDAEIDAEIHERATTPERVRLSVITLNALPEDAEPGTEPTEEHFARALDEAETVLEMLRGGADFGETAAAQSDDPTAEGGGDVGFITADNPAYPELFEATRGVADGELVGPVRVETGYIVARVTERQPESRDEDYLERFEQNGVENADYRAYIADQLLDEEFRAYFEERVVLAQQEQRRVAQIFIAEQAGEVVPERRVRHILVQPIPGEQDQSAATEAQWQAALTHANEVREELLAADADWEAIASAESADPGSAGQGGDLGWVAVESPGFVPEFAEAMQTLDVGELSEPVRTQFGYHLIQVTDERASAAEQVEAIVDELNAEPESFAEVAARESEDAETAANGGEIGWVARYELEPPKEEAIFALSEVGAVSDPVILTAEDGTTEPGTYIFRLLEIDPDREIEPERLERIRESGYDRWLAEQRESVPTWIDAEYDPAAGVASP